MKKRKEMGKKTKILHTAKEKESFSPKQIEEFRLNLIMPLAVIFVLYLLHLLDFCTDTDIYQ